MAFYYETDELGYDLDIVETRDLASLRVSNSSPSTQFSDPSNQNVSYSCNPPRVLGAPVNGQVRVDVENNTRRTTNGLIVGGADDVNGTYAPPPADSPTGTPGTVTYTPTTGPHARTQQSMSYTPIPPGIPPAVRPPPNAPVPPTIPNHEVSAAVRPTNVPPPPTGFTQVGAAQRNGNGWDYYYKSDGTSPTYQTRNVPDHAAGSPDVPGAAAPVTGAVPPAILAARNGAPSPNPHAPGTQVRPSVPTVSPTGTQSTGGANETRLRETTLPRMGVTNAADREAFMTRFPPAGNARQNVLRERAIAEYLPANERADRRDVRPNKMGTNAAWVRQQSARNMMQNGNANMRQANMGPQDAYDHYRSMGMIDSSVPRPTSNEMSAWAGVHNGNDWLDHATPSSSNVQEMNTNPLYTSNNARVNAGEVRESTQRHVVVNAARDPYVAWGAGDGHSGIPEQVRRDHPDWNPAQVTAEARTRAGHRFNELATRGGMMQANPDGTHSVSNTWHPNDTDPNSPAHFFFPGTAGEPVHFDGPNGSLRPADAATFRHEDPLAGTTGHAAVDPANRVDRVARQAATMQVQRDAYYASLTGNVPDGSTMHVVNEGDKHYLVGPDPSHPGQESRTEFRVMGPPALSTDEARAVMQSQNLTDSEGRPLPSATADSFTSRLGQVQTGTFGRNQALGEAAEWERAQIPGILAGPPYNKSPQEITRYMQSRGWLGENPDVGQMETFRRDASTHAVAGSSDAARIARDVGLANVAANDPQNLTQRDRAATIQDNLRHGNPNQADRNSAEARNGRQAGGRDAAASRDSNERIHAADRESTERTHREDRESTRAESQRQRDFQAEQARIQQTHDSAEKKKDRGMQIFQALLSFLGGIIGPAVSAGFQNSNSNLSSQIIGGIKGRN